MADNKSREEIEKILAERIKAKRKGKTGFVEEDSGLTLNSMMDMMTIILVFLLKSYGEEPSVSLPKPDVPISTAEILPKDMTLLTINKEGIYLIRQRIVELEDGKVNGNFKKGGDSGLIIEPLETALRTEVERQKSIAMANGSNFEGDIAIVADQATSYRLLVEVMQTAIGTEFKHFRFAVIQGSMEQSGRYASAPALPQQ